jgi:hypothetical protein
MEGPQADDPKIRATALVWDAFSAIEWRDLARAGASPRVSAAVGAIQEAPDVIRRRCMLLAAAEPGWRGGTLVALITGEAAFMTPGDLASVLPALPRLLPDDQRSLAETRADALLSRAEAIWADLDEAGKAELRAAILRVEPKVGHTAAALRLRRLAAPDAVVSYTLIDEASEVGKALRRALESISEPDEAKARLIAVLAAYPATGKPPQTWRSDAEAALTDLNDPVAAVRALLDAAIDAPDYSVHHEFQGHHTDIIFFASQGNEAFLCAVTMLASRVAAGSTRDDGAGLLSRLRQLALKAITVIGNWKPRSVRLANHCVQAIADAALPSSITELLSTERSTRHGSLLRAARSAIEALAAAQGLTRDQLLEMAVEDHGLGSDGTARVQLAESWLAVIQASERTASVSYADPGGTPRKSLPAAVKRASADSLAAATKDLKAIRVTISNERARLDACLAAGRSWSVPQWRRRCLEHPVTGQLARTLTLPLLRERSGAVLRPGVRRRDPARRGPPAHFLRGDARCGPVHRRDIGRRGPRMAGPGRGQAVRRLLAQLRLRGPRRWRRDPARGAGRTRSDARDRRPLRP